MTKINNTNNSAYWGLYRERQHYSIVDGCANLYRHCGNQYCISLESWELIYLKTQLYYFSAYIQRVFHSTTRTLAQSC